MIEISEAFELIAETIAPHPKEGVNLMQSVGRILAEPVLADVNSPPHTKSVMDGYAVRSQDVAANIKLKLLETIIAGDVPTRPLVPGTCSRIMTGAPVPEGADSVIMVEMANASKNKDGEVITFSIDSVEAGKHVLPQASSFSIGDTIFSAGHQIRPLDIGLLAEVGAHQVAVVRQITASVLPTGNELVSADQKPGAGQIRNSNGPMIFSLLKHQNVAVVDLGIGRDERKDLRAKIAEGLQSDLLMLSGGVSAGTMDLVPELLQESGVVEVFHKIRVKPGKPIWFGVLKRRNQSSTYVFGLPGNPVSSLVGFQLFVCAAIRRMNGMGSLTAASTLAELAEPHESRGDRPTYWPASWVEDESDVRKIRPLTWQGSSDLRALGLAEALIYFPVTKSSFEVGDKVTVISI